ncbi:putative starch degradation products transporter permease amyD [Paenibacillus terrae HPL-003]|uniref:Putative starch degradation products transporter permease amyD n=1 Tax=Paenibacillus terrae (strain HPL-003) TaxID=985665 RepID=G7VVU0_PAETH|nr:putative starch degradation products transporter permease amyD [Paenibacillus terrae HPL-003]
MISSNLKITFFWVKPWSFKVFELNSVLTKGGPFKSTESVALDIYNEAFTNNRLGLGVPKPLFSYR